MAHVTDEKEINFTHIEVVEGSVLIGKTSATARLREDYSSLLVAIQSGNNYKKPTGEEIFNVGDILWLVGNSKKLSQIKN
jgi:Trk K+ transport system NAD-binding subunit